MVGKQSRLKSSRVPNQSCVLSRTSVPPCSMYLQRAATTTFLKSDQRRYYSNWLCYEIRRVAWHFEGLVSFPGVGIEMLEGCTTLGKRPVLLDSIAFSLDTDFGSNLKSESLTKDLR
jgi:hypothetical protein